jgi:hypothetical protein
MNDPTRVGHHNFKAHAEMDQNSILQGTAHTWSA